MPRELPDGDRLGRLTECTCGFLSPLTDVSVEATSVDDEYLIMDERFSLFFEIYLYINCRIYDSALP